MLKIFRDLMHSKIPIILIMGVIVMFTTGCSYDDADNPRSEIRREALLREILIEMQETNATLKRIEDRLEDK